MLARRAYKPGAALYAQRPVKFRGVQYAHHDELPVDQMSAEKHRNFWLSGIASHEKYGPFDKRRIARPVVGSTPPPVAEPKRKPRQRDAR